MLEPGAAPSPEQYSRQLKEEMGLVRPIPAAVPIVTRQPLRGDVQPGLLEWRLYLGGNRSPVQ